MKDIQFIASASHTDKPKKGMRNILIIIVFCILLMLVSRLFFAGRVHEADVYYRGIKMRGEVGWPANLFSIGYWGIVSFPLFYIYIRFKQDLRLPAIGVTNDGIFINAVLLRKAFIPWDNIEHVELRGHSSNPTIRIFFKDINLLLKGQFFILKSISKATLKTDPSVGISNDDAVGNLISIFDIIKEKGILVNDKMEGRDKIK
ncbi:hypothetical protein OX284_002940 [Flavobacterium sp. SUN046]|uniref:hypothetical protein n=1 Tax=Flavobacterium sp. SUN046 TaxID=3002440 RepID=UPI002DBCBF44|nr:hypothetical protein [Flavobacterium sp. SUN046]MEC4048372.1 hypothetical protein [Flavobacterium sp. SUN046]